jgi:hypothetical protein
MFFPIEPEILVCIVQTGIFSVNGVESPVRIIDPEMNGGKNARRYHMDVTPDRIGRHFC